MNKNDEIILNIDGVTADGFGIGRHDGFAVFVPLTAPKDTVRVKIVKVKKTYAYGKLTEIITPSADRTDPDCEVFSRCGGCVYRHISYAAECEIKEKKVFDNIKRIGGIDLPPKKIITADNRLRYRNKAQYPISDTGNAGFFAVHSHRIIENNDCLLQPEFFADICKTVTDWIKEKNISIYNEQIHTGLLRHLYIRYAAKTDEVMIVLVINGKSITDSEYLINRLTALLGDRLKSVQININTEKTNVILGKRCITVYGHSYITDILCGVKVRLSPLSFYQVNRDMAERLYQKAAEYAEPENKNILDLYCGAGTIGLSMANTAKSIIGVEIVPDAVRDAEINAEMCGITNARFICADASAAAEKLAEQNIHPDVVIVDPPRKGCDAALIKTVADSFSPERVVYVSCDSATLARDIKIFSQYGYDLIEYTPVDMFPGTAHVETVVLLSRQKVDEHIYFNVNVADLPKTTRTTATYPEIKAYIKDKYGLCVSSLNIAQVKDKHGFEKRENYNKGKEGHKVPQCTPEKEKAIEDAFKYFGMI